MGNEQHETQLQRMCAGDESAYREIFEQFFPVLTRFSASLVHSAAQAEEIAADVLIGLWRNRHQLDHIRQLRVYLMTSVRNRSLNFLKSAYGRRVVSLEDLDVQVSLKLQDPEQICISNEMRRKLEAAVQSLPPRCKLIFKLVREEGLSYQEVASVLDISVKTVDAQLVTALKKITASVMILYQQS